MTFLSPHPNYMTDELLRFIVDEPKMLKYLGLPLQYGDDKVLKQMNRKYTVKEYKRQIAYLKKYFGEQESNSTVNLYLTTDIIVGFGNETEETFNKTYKLLQKIRFNQVFVASYSERPYTPASISVPDSIPLEIKTQRKNRIRKLTEKIAKEENQKLVGKTISCRAHDSHRGITYANQYIELDSVPSNLISKQIDVKITYGGRYGIKGTPVFV